MVEAILYSLILFHRVESEIFKKQGLWPSDIQDARARQDYKHE